MPCRADRRGIGFGQARSRALAGSQAASRATGRIADGAETGPAFHRIDDPIQLHTAPVEATADWRAVVEGELSRPFDAARGPLTRATAVWVPDGASVVLTFHHAVMDALSGTRVLHEVMRARGRKSRGLAAASAASDIPSCSRMANLRPYWRPLLPSMSAASNAITHCVRNHFECPPKLWRNREAPACAPA